MIAGGGFLFLLYPPRDEETKIIRNKLSFMHTKRLIHFLKDGSFHVGAIPCLPLNFLSVTQREGHIEKYIFYGVASISQFIKDV